MRSKSGFALVYLLLITTIALLLIGSLLGLARQQLFVSQLALRSDKALYAAQAGLAASVAQFNANPQWTGGFSNELVPQGTATFTLTFASDPDYPGALESVNNLQGTTAANSYLGPGTVPPGMALLVIRGQESSSTKVLEAFVGGGDPTLSAFAMNASGSVHLHGRTTVDGLASLETASAIAAGIHSNASEGSDQITWTGPGLCNVSGQLSASSTDSAAIRLDSGAVVGIPSAVGQPQVASPHYDIPGVVQAHRNASNPSLLPGPGGVVSLAPGDYYLSGNQSLAGDLVLQPGAHLYVQGDLTVNGSIRGSGLVAVTGDTSFFGSADVSNSDSDYLALLTHGNVWLKGFNGTAYINSLARQSAAGTLSGDPSGQFGRSWSDVQSAYDALVPNLQLVAANPTQAPPGGDLTLDTLMGQLGDWSGTGVANPQNNLATMLAHLPTGGTTARFMQHRLAVMNELFRPSDRTSTGAPQPDPLIGPVIFQCVSGQTATAAEIAALPNWLRDFDLGLYSQGGPPDNPYYSTAHGGVFDFIASVVVNAQPPTQVYRDLMLSHYRSFVNTISRFQSASFGSAFFQGIIYTNGALVAQNELTLFGGVVALDDGSQVPARVGGVDVKPGDIYLADAHLTYVKAMFNNGTSSMAHAGLVAPITWHVR